MNNEIFAARKKVRKSKSHCETTIGLGNLISWKMSDEIVAVPQWHFIISCHAII